MLQPSPALVHDGLDQFASVSNQRVVDLGRDLDLLADDVRLG